MIIRVREGGFSDIELLIQACQLQGTALFELERWRTFRFTETGEPKNFVTGYPETVLVAESEGRVIGYLHFFIDCWDGYDTEIILKGYDPGLESGESARTMRLLDEVYRKNISEI